MPVQSSRRAPSSAPTTTRSRTHNPPATRSTTRTGKGGGSKRSRRKDPLWAKLVVTLGALLMMGSGVAIVGTKVLIGQATSNIKQDNLVGAAGKTEAEGGNNLDGPIDMLLLGVDARKRLAHDNVRADTIIILHIPASHDQAYLLSIPRDTEADIPDFKKSHYPGGTDKINAAFFHGAQNGGGWAGGAQLMAQTIRNMTGISFDGAAIIDFGGFKGIIDALGSVHMCVDQEVKSIHMMRVNGKPMWLADARKASGDKRPVVHKKGCREMEGWEALDYSRQRKTLTNGDYDRQKNQQKLIKAMAKKAMSGGVMTNPIKLKKLMDAAGKSFILDTGGVPVPDFIFTLRGLAASDLVLLKTNGGTFHGNFNERETFDEVTREMFAAVKNDKLGQFVIYNPGVLVTTKK